MAWQVQTHGKIGVTASLDSSGARRSAIRRVEAKKREFQSRKEEELIKKAREDDRRSQTA
jgi:hypothetical protein